MTKPFFCFLKFCPDSASLVVVRILISQISLWSLRIHLSTVCLGCTDYKLLQPLITCYCPLWVPPSGELLASSQAWGGRFLHPSLLIKLFRLRCISYGCSYATPPFTPAQRFSVEVIHSQKRAHRLEFSRRSKIAVIF